jgi:metal-responsive CopG/Arc/MetJ family transcriptional regulator
MAVNPVTTVRKLVSLPRELASSVEDYRFERRIRTESEAIRRLIELGLRAAQSQSVEASSP